MARVSSVRVLRSDEPEVERLLSTGWAVADESWGARLQVTDEALASCEAAVAVAEESGWTVRAMTGAEASAVVALDVGARADYPPTAATSHEAPDGDALRAELDSGERWAYGAVAAGGSLDAVTVLYPCDSRVETDFTVVRSSARRRGLAKAVKAAAVLDLAARGHRLFGTGGAGVNAGSRRANEALGYVVTERWLHLTPPGE